MRNDKLYMPYGDLLRQFLCQSWITKSDLKLLLRDRGVFVHNEEKSSTVPIIVKTGLSFFELEALRNKVKVKEENPKIKTQYVEWSGSDTPLIEAIPKKIDFKKIAKTPFSNYEMIGAPNFKPVSGDQNHLEVEFRIERRDYTKCLHENTKEFSGKIILKKDEGLGRVNITLNHTSVETKKVADAISKHVVAGMKENGCVNREAKIQKIRFNDFTNMGRIAFLSELSQSDNGNKLSFVDTKDIGFKPIEIDESLPSEMEWMRDKLKNLILQGKGLHEVYFIEDEKYHPYIEVYNFEADYDFEIDGWLGSCGISFEFSGYGSKDQKDAELQINVVKLKLGENKVSSGGRKQPKESWLKEQIIAGLDDSKMSLYDIHQRG